MKDNSSIGERNNYSSGRAVGDAAYLALSVLIVKVLGLIYKIPLSSYLGDEGMGYFNSAYTIYSFFYLLCSAGVPKAITFLFLNDNESSNKRSGYQNLRISMRIFLMIGILLTTAFIFLAGPISVLIGNRGSFLTMLTIAPTIIFVSLSGVMRGYLNAEMKLIHVGISQIIEGVCRLLLGLLLAREAIDRGLSLEEASALTILGVTLGSIVSFVYSFCCIKDRKSDYKERQNIKAEDYLNVGKSILKISLPITLSSAIMSFGNLIDLSLIMKRLETIGYSEAQASALYGNYTTLAVPMFNFVISLITPLSVSFLPVFLKAGTSKERTAALKDSLGITAFVSAPMIIGLSCFSGEILALLFGKGPAESGDSLLTLLMPAALFSSLLLIVNSALESSGSIRAPLVSMLIGGLFKLVISHFMLGTSRFGISGAPISTVISYGISLLISVLYLSAKHKISVPIFSTQIIPYLNASLSVFISKEIYSLLIRSRGEALSLGLSILTCGLIYVIMSLFSGAFTVKKLIKIAKYTKIAE